MANWDNEIDEVARRLTEGQAGAGFKARVLARIDAGGGSWRARRLTIVWSRAALGGVALVALAAGLSSWKTPPLSPGREPASTAQLPSRDLRPVMPEATTAPAEAVVRRNPVAASPPRVTATRTPAASGPGNATGTPAGDPIDWSAGVYEVAAIKPDPIDIPPLTVEGMETVEAIVVPRLAVAQIEIAAIAQ